MHSIPENEVQAIVAAAIEKAAHVYLDAIQAELNDLSPTADYESYTWGERLFDKLNQLPILADQNALREHDAALRAAHNADLVAASLDFDEERADFKAEIIGLRESYCKLEAENAALREALQDCHRAIGHSVDCRLLQGPDCTCGHAKLQVAALDKATRTLLAKSGGVK